MTNRTQAIRNAVACSNYLPISSGVPQGSILGPLLFLLYVNDLPLEINSDTDMYADDSTFHCKGKDINEIQLILQSDINKTQRWCMKNNMAINPTKTTCMIIGSKQKLSCFEDLNLYVYNNRITNVELQKLLGVYIDKNLTWKLHIDKTCKKLVSKLFLLKRIQYFLTPDVKQLFYNAYITPIFDYGCLIWSKANTVDIHRITKLQTRAARIMLNEHRDKSSYEMLRTLNWLAFPVRCKYFIGLLIFKAINNLTPSYISDLITFSSNNTYVLRSVAKRDISHNKPNTNYLKKTFSYSGMEIWNRIPTEIRNSQNINTFKGKFKSFLFENC